MSTYKTKDGTKTGFVPGVGPIVDGLLQNAPEHLENANLELVTEPLSPQPTAAPTAPAAPVASPTAAQPSTAPATAINQETN